jgi:hypothetical protein
VRSDTTASGGKTVELGQAGRFGFDGRLSPITDRDVYIQLAKNANVTTMRTDFIWTNIESTKGTFGWSSSDMVMRLTA